MQLLLLINIFSVLSLQLKNYCSTVEKTPKTMIVGTSATDADAELWRNLVSKNHIQPEYGDEQADAGPYRPTHKKHLF